MRLSTRGSVCVSPLLMLVFRFCVFFLHEDSGYIVVT